MAKECPLRSPAENFAVEFYQMARAKDFTAAFPSVNEVICHGWLLIIHVSFAQSKTMLADLFKKNQAF